MKVAIITLVMLAVLFGRVETAFGSITHTIRARFGPHHDDTALCIAKAEGRLNPLAVGASGELSTFQILPIHFYRTVSSRIHGRVRRIFVDPRLLRARDQRHAIEVAYVMSVGGTDFGPWTGTYGRGMCHGLS